MPAQPVQLFHRAYAHDVRQEPVHCRSCGLPTKGGKPYCSKHAHLMPYAQEVIRRVNERALEAAGKKPLKMLIVEAVEFLTAMEDDRISIKKFALALGCEEHVASSIGRKLGLGRSVSSHGNPMIVARQMRKAVAS